MSNESDALKRIYADSNEFIILGLTGRTGSGCSTAAEILEITKESINIPESSKIYTSDNDQRKYRIVRDYIKENWKKLVVLNK